MTWVALARAADVRGPGVVIELVPAPRLAVETHPGWRKDAVLATFGPDGAVESVTIRIDDEGVAVADHLERFRGPRSDEPGLLLSDIDDEAVEALKAAVERIGGSSTVQRLVSGFAEHTRGMPRWIGWSGVVGPVVMLAPLPVVAVVSGLQFELLRGVLVAGLGLYVVRLTRADRNRLAELVAA